MCDRMQDNSFGQAIKHLRWAFCICGLNISPKLNCFWKSINVMGIILTLIFFTVSVAGTTEYVIRTVGGALTEPGEQTKIRAVDLFKNVLGMVVPYAFFVEFWLKLKTMKSIVQDMSQHAISDQSLFRRLQVRISVLVFSLAIGEVVVGLVATQEEMTEAIIDLLQIAKITLVVVLGVISFGKSLILELLMMAIIQWLRMILKNPATDACGDPLRNAVTRHQFVSKQIEKINQCFRLLTICIVFMFSRSINNFPIFKGTAISQMSNMEKATAINSALNFTTLFPLIYLSCRLNNEMNDIFKVKTDFVSKKTKRLHKHINAISQLDHQSYLVSYLLDKPRLTFAWAQELTFLDVFQIVANTYEMVGVYKCQYTYAFGRPKDITTWD